MSDNQRPPKAVGVIRTESGGRRLVTTGKPGIGRGKLAAATGSAGALGFAVGNLHGRRGGYRAGLDEDPKVRRILRPNGVAKSGAIVDNASRVRRVQPRHPSGRFVSHTNDLMVIHPRYSTSRRAPRDSKLQVWGKGKDSQSKTFMGKADDGALAQAMTAGGSRRGRRLA